MESKYYSYGACVFARIKLNGVFTILFVTIHDKLTTIWQRKWFFFQLPASIDKIQSSELCKGYNDKKRTKLPTKMLTIDVDNNLFDKEKYQNIFLWTKWEIWKKAFHESIEAERKSFSVLKRYIFHRHHDHTAAYPSEKQKTNNKYFESSRLSPILAVAVCHTRILCVATFIFEHQVV